MACWIIAQSRSQLAATADNKDQATDYAQVSYTAQGRRQGSKTTANSPYLLSFYAPWLYGIPRSEAVDRASPYNGKVPFVRDQLISSTNCFEHHA